MNAKTEERLRKLSKYQDLDLIIKFRNSGKKIEAEMQTWDENDDELDNFACNGETIEATVETLLNGISGFCSHCGRPERA